MMREHLLKLRELLSCLCPPVSCAIRFLQLRSLLRTYWYVQSPGGVDGPNLGKSAEAPFGTIEEALCRCENNDVILVLPGHKEKEYAD